MYCTIRPLVCSFLIVCFVVTSSAFCQVSPGGSGGGTPGTAGGTTNTPVPDTGTVFCTPNPATGKVNCWVIRNFSTASAISIFEDPVFSVPSAKIRNYVKNPSGFSAQNTTVTYTTAATPPTTVTQSLDVISVRLEEVRDTLGRVTYYNMNYFPEGFNPDGSPKGVKVLIGKLKFSRGSDGRSSSDISIRFGAAVRPSNPCDEPPLDDLGEEEEVPAVSGKAPELTLSLTPSPVVSP
jgi:hypothetical protein